MIIGVLGMFSGIIDVLGSLDSMNGKLFFIGVIELVMALLFIYFGFKIDRYLRRSPKILIAFIAVVVAIRCVVALLGKGYAAIVASLLIGWYLIYNVKKLSLLVKEVKK